VIRAALLSNQCKQQSGCLQLGEDCTAVTLVSGLRH